MSGPALPPETTPFWGPCYYSPIMRITRLKGSRQQSQPEPVEQPVREPVAVA